jgi:hypothetical protein
MRTVPQGRNRPEPFAENAVAGSGGGCGMTADDHIAAVVGSWKYVY